MAEIKDITQAEKILEDKTNFEDFDDAVKYLLANDANNPAVDFVNYVDENDRAEAIKQEKLERVKAYFKEVVDANDFEYGKYEAAVQVWKDVKNEEFTFDDLLNKDKFLDKEEDIVTNLKDIADLSRDTDVSEEIHNEVEGYKNQVDIVDNEGKAVNTERSEKLWASFLATSWNAVSTELSDDKGFFNSSNKKRLFIDRVKDYMHTELGRMAGSSAVDTNKSISENEYNVRAAEDAFDNGHKVTVNEDAFANAAVNVEMKMERKKESFLKRGFKKAAEVMKKMKKGFSSFLDKYIGKPMEIKRAVVENFTFNKGKTLTNVGASVAVIGLSAVSMPMALASAAAYAVYHSQSWRWDYVAKRNRMAAEAKKAGEDTKAWSGKTGLRNAKKAIMANPKEKAKLARKKKINLLAGLGGAALVAAATPVILSGGAVVAGVTLAGAGAVAATKFGASLLRIAGVNVNAGAEVVEARKEYKKTRSAEDKKAYDRSKGALAISLLFSGVAETLAANSLAEHVSSAETVNTSDLSNGLADANDNAHDVANAGENVANSGEAPLANDSTEQITGADHGAENGGTESNVDGGNAAESTETPAVEVPTEYSPDMGVSEDQWKEMHNKFTGIFEDRAELFGMENKTPEETWQNIYQNIENARAADENMFAGLTNEQVMYRYMKLIENTERVHAGPEGYLVTRLDADGQPMYWVNQDEMRAMNDILLCGKEVQISAEALNENLARIDDNGNLLGEGANIGKTNNAFVGFGRGEGCPDGTDNVNAWKKGLTETVRPRGDGHADTTTVTDAAKAGDGHADTTTVTDAAKAGDGNADSTTVTTKATITSTSSNEGRLDATDPKSQDHMRQGGSVNLDRTTYTRDGGR